MKKWIQAIRLGVLSASVLPAILGAVIARYETDQFHWGLFALTILGIIAVHTGANLINDYFDYQSGADQANKDYLNTVTGGSRVIVEGKLSLRTVLVTAIICLAVATGIGIYLAIVSGPVILWFVLFGLITAIVYTTPKINLINLKLGEVIIGLDFGVLTVMGAAYVQSSHLSLRALLVSLPVGILIAAILLINEFQDYQSDKAVAKKTTVVRIGRQKGFWLLAGMLVVMFILVLGLVGFGTIPVWGLLALLSAPLFFQALRHARQFFDQPLRLGSANLSIIKGQLVLMVLLIIAFSVSVKH